VDNRYNTGHHIVALGNAHDVSEVQYEDPWPKFSGYPKTMQRTDGRLFTINRNGTISPVGAPHLVFGLRSALPEATGGGLRRSSTRRSSSVSSVSSLGSLVSISLLEKMSRESFSLLHAQQANEDGRWLLDVIKYFSKQVMDTLQDIEMRLTCCEAEQVAADELPDRPSLDLTESRSSERFSRGLSRTESRSDILYEAHSEEARSRITSMDGITTRGAYELWEGACQGMLAICDGLLTAVSTYSVLQQKALIRAFRDYTPKKDSDPTREALMQTEALRAFGDAIKVALKASETGRVSEPAAPPHPLARP
jgi:hypothetical protein